MRRRTGASAGVPAGTRSATSAAVPTNSRGTTTSPASRVRVVDDDPLEAVADLESDALAPVLEGDPAAIATHLEPGPPEDERAVRVVLELVLGVDPAADPDVARRAAGEACAPRRR